MLKYSRAIVQELQERWRLGNHPAEWRLGWVSCLF